MSPLLAGIVRADVDSGTRAVLPTDLERIELANAQLAHASSVSTASEDGIVCVALGRPRFAKPEDIAAAQHRGIASAWIDAIRREGINAFSLARGRFAVAYVDAAARRALLACDRFGTWPLCYRALDGELAFSNRADGVPAQGRRVSEQAIFEYLYFHMIPAPRTIYECVERLPAGHVLVWERGSASCQRYWNVRFDEMASADLAAKQAEFRDLVRASVEREAAESSIGAFLSGGTDSSTIAGMLCKVLGRPARTYSIGFDASGYDEMDYARIAARHFGTDHHEYYITPDDVVRGIPQVASHYDQPFGNSSVVPSWVCARNGHADGIGKMLAGDGGDELFGGNSRYAKHRMFDAYARLPESLRRRVVEPALRIRAVNRLPLVRKAASYVEQARVPLPNRMQMYNLLLRLGLDTVFEPAFRARIDARVPNQMQQQTWDAIDAKSPVNRMLGYDWKYTLADNDLPKVIGATDLAGVDVGFPLLADELVDFSLGLPAGWKVRGLTLRWFFKQALRGFLPDEIIRKKKHGFGLPFGAWALTHDALNRLARESLRSFAQRGAIRPAFLDELMTHWLASHPAYYGEMVWIVMMLEQWMQTREPDWRFQD